MRLRVDARTAGLWAALAAPPAARVAAGLSPAPALEALAGIAAVTAALVAWDGALRRMGLAAVGVPTAILTLYGTGLVWHETAEPGRAAFALVAGTLLVRAWWPRAGRGLPALARGATLGIALIGVALLAERLGGTPLAVGPPILLDSLFSSRHGVLFWAPVLTVGALGLLARAWRGRGDAAGALGALATMAIVNASLRPWWGGGLDNARVLPALPLFALGMATVLDAVSGTARRRPLRLAAAAGALLVAWNLLLMAQYRAEMIPRDDTVSFPAVAENSARLLASALGAPVAWPANWIFAARHRIPAARYDLLAGQDVLAAGAGEIDVGDLDTDAALLGEGWSVRHPCGASVCREVEGRARMFLPVVDARAAAVHVRVQGAGTLRLAVNGRELARARLTDDFAEPGGALARGELRPGPNELVLEVSPEGHALVDAVRVLPLKEGP